MNKNYFKARMLRPINLDLVFGLKIYENNKGIIKQN